MRLMHSPHMILKSTSVSLLFVFAISGLLMPGFDNAIGQDREPNKATLVVRADQAGPVAVSPTSIIGVMVSAHAISVRDDLMPAGVALILTRSAHMNSSTCAKC